MADQSIVWVVAFSVLVASPSPILHILLRSDGLTSKCLSLEVKVLWEGTPWCWPSKKSLLRSVIPVVSTTLALDILTCDTSLVATKYGMCTVSCIPVSISVSWTLLHNESAQIYAIPADKYSSSSLCETFGKRMKWVSQSCGDVRTFVVLVTKWQKKQLFLTYRVKYSLTLQGRWCPLVFTCKGCLARQCDDGASGLDSRGCDPVFYHP